MVYLDLQYALPDCDGNIFLFFLVRKFAKKIPKNAKCNGPGMSTVLYIILYTIDLYTGDIYDS